MIAEQLEESQQMYQTRPGNINDSMVQIDINAEKINEVKGGFGEEDGHYLLHEEMKQSQICINVEANEKIGN